MCLFAHDLEAISSKPYERGNAIYDAQRSVSLVLYKCNDCEHNEVKELEGHWTIEEIKGQSKEK